MSKSASAGGEEAMEGVAGAQVSRQRPTPTPTSRVFEFELRFPLHAMCVFAVLKNTNSNWELIKW